MIRLLIQINGTDVESKVQTDKATINEIGLLVLMMEKIKVDFANSDSVFETVYDIKKTNKKDEDDENDEKL